MIKLEQKSYCTGCSACAQICPKNCIEMNEDNEGFLYPNIDRNRCINCHACNNVCSIYNQNTKHSTPKAYAMQALENHILKSSSSGGIFTLLAREVLKENGVVFGVGFNENFEVRHMFIEKEEQLEKLRGSKYVQSQIGNLFIEVRNFLKCGRKVLFSGTPCQIEGLKIFLKRDYSNLLCVDILCHGTPSPKVWRKYLDFRKNNDGQVPKNISFRSKNISWKEFSMEFIYDNNQYCESMHKDIFIKGFLRNVYLRPACYSCRYKSLERASDITIGDFWEVKDFTDKFNDNGTSLVFVHTQLGQSFINNIQPNSVYLELLDSTKIPNGGLYKSAFYNLKRKAFFRDLEHIDFSLLYQKYFGERFLSKIERTLSRKISNISK